MNYWTEASIELANQRNYLDLLFKVYPMSVNLKREIEKEDEDIIKKHFDERNNMELLEVLLKQDLFPIKDSYVAFLKRDNTAIGRNPETVSRLVGMLYEMGLDEIYTKITLPKETNRQIGPLFYNWIEKGSLGCKITQDHAEILNSKENIVLNSSDANMALFAREHLGYTHTKGIDFIAKFNNKYVVAEAKFLTDYGGHQNAQFNDAITTMKSKFNTNKEVVPVAILDGVLYLESKGKMFRNITEEYKADNILSAVLLRDFLYSL